MKAAKKIDRDEIMDKKLMGKAVRCAFTKLYPKAQIKNPIMFLVYLSAVLTAILFIMSLLFNQGPAAGFVFSIMIVLWFTVLFANFAEAAAEVQGMARADSLRGSLNDVKAYRIPSPDAKEKKEKISAAMLRKGDLAIVEAGQRIPADGVVIEGAASVDESAITGESAPVIREAGSDRQDVTGGTTVISDWLIIRITKEEGDGFLNKMIMLVEGAARKRTRKEASLNYFLMIVTLFFIIITTGLYAYTVYASGQKGSMNPITVTSFAALIVCLAPTTIGALLSAIRIAGMSRLNKANVLVLNSMAIESAGSVDILLLNKTGTITLGGKYEGKFIGVDGHTEQELADAAQLSSIADETPEGRSIAVLAKETFGIRERRLNQLHVQFVPFSRETQISGVNMQTGQIRKGSADAIRKYVEANGGKFSSQCDTLAARLRAKGGIPLVIAKNYEVLGLVYLKDMVRTGMKDQFSALRRIGIRTVMLTGDNPVTAAAVAAEAGVDDFLSEVTPAEKLSVVRRFQEEGHLVAMTGSGADDAPALAQADVAVAMNSGTPAAKEAGNMLDLDSLPTKIIEVVHIGRQLLTTRRSLTTFSVVNDFAKWFVVIPVMFAEFYPELSAFNFLNLHSGKGALLSAVIYTALSIILLVPLAIKGVGYKEIPERKLSLRNVLIYGGGGIISPFLCIKLIDYILMSLSLLM